MKIKKLFLSFVALAAVFGLAACNDGAAVSGITISAKDNVHEIQVDDTLQLTATVFPENAKNKNVEWSVSNTSTASVSESGLVKGLAVGTVDIIATSVENKNISQKYALVVKEKAATVVTPTSIELVGADKVKEVAVGDTIRLESIVKPDGASQQVVWSSSDNTLATVSTRGEVTGVKEGKVTITVTAKDVATVKASVELTVVKGNSSSGDFASMPITSHADFMEAENGTNIKVKGIVTHVAPVAEGKVSYYIQNGSDGYYVYDQNAASYPVEEGKCYEVGGVKKYYRGNHEIADVSYVKEITNTLTFTYNDVKGKNVSSLEAMKPYHNSYIEATAQIKAKPEIGTKAYGVSVEIEGKTISLRVDPSNMSASEFEAFGNLFKSVVANTPLEFKGIMTAFGYSSSSTNTQIQLLKSADITMKEATPADQVAAAKDSVSVQSVLVADVTTISLPIALEGFNNIAISWESDAPAVINAETGAITHPENDTIVTLTATLAHKTETEIKDTKSFKVIVLGSSFEHERLVYLDLEDAEVDPDNSYGLSATKPSYNDGTVTLGTPATTWLLQNALIGGDNSDHREGTFAIRAYKKNAETIARVEVQQSGEYNYIEFIAARYGNNPAATLAIEYLLDGTDTWVTIDIVLNVNSATTELFRVALPEGSKRVAICVASGTRVNVDNIALYK